MKKLIDVAKMAKKKNDILIFSNLFTGRENEKVKELCEQMAIYSDKGAGENRVYLGTYRGQVWTVLTYQLFDKTYRIEQKIEKIAFENVSLKQWTNMLVPDILLKQSVNQSEILGKRDVIRYARKQMVMESTNDWEKFLFSYQVNHKIRVLSYEIAKVDEKKIEEMQEHLQTIYREDVCSREKSEKRGAICIWKKGNMKFPKIWVRDDLTGRKSCLEEYSESELLKMKISKELPNEENNLEYVATYLLVALICPLRARRLSKTLIST